MIHYKYGQKHCWRCYTSICDGVIYVQEIGILKQVHKKLERLRRGEEEGGKEVLRLKEVEDLLNDLRRGK